MRPNALQPSNSPGYRGAMMCFMSKGDFQFALKVRNHVSNRQMNCGENFTFPVARALSNLSVSQHWVIHPSVELIMEKCYCHCSLWFACVIPISARCLCIRVFFWLLNGCWLCVLLVVGSVAFPLRWRWWSVFVMNWARPMRVLSVFLNLA